MTYFSRVLGPFFVGLIVASGLFFSREYWLPDTAILIRFLVVAAGLLLVLVVGVWLAYRKAVEGLPDEDRVALKQAFGAALQDPSRLFQKEFWSKQLSPIAANAGSAIGTWLAFSASLGVVTLFLTNILLLSTLLVQIQSSDRLASQNDLLNQQNEFQELQARIDANRLLQEELTRNQLFNRRWGELHAFRLNAYGTVSNEKFTADRVVTACARAGGPQCSDAARLSEISLPARQVRERLTERKEAFLDEVETAAFRDPVLNRSSGITEIVGALVVGSNDCFGKEEFSLAVAEDLAALLRLEFAASAFENSRTGEGSQSVVGTSETAAKLDNAYVDFRRRFFGQSLVSFSWDEFSEALAGVVERLNEDVEAVMDYCKFALEDSDRLIGELQSFLERTAQRAE